MRQSWNDTAARWSEMKTTTRITILGCPFDSISFTETVERIQQSVLTGNFLQIVPGSVDFVMKCIHDEGFSDVLRKAHLVIADGVPIVWSAALLGTPLRGRVSGTELVWSCAEISMETGCPIALIGAMPGVASKAARQMERRYPGARLHTIPTPYPLTHENSIQIAETIRASGARIVLVALGAPRQERWVQEYLPACGVPVGIGVGSAFDIISGKKPRAPRWMQDLGLEWLHRTLLEPKRLGRRYFIDDMPYLFHLAGEVARRRIQMLGDRA